MWRDSAAGAAFLLFDAVKSGWTVHLAGLFISLFVCLLVWLVGQFFLAAEQDWSVGPKTVKLLAHGWLMGEDWSCRRWSDER